MSSTDATQCLRCGQWTSAASRFCGQCGGDLAAPVELFTDPNALDSSATSAAPGVGPGGYGTSIGTSPVGSGPLTPRATPGFDSAGEHTQHRSGPHPAPSGPVIVVAPPGAADSTRGLKIAVGVVAALIVVCAVLVTVLVVGGSPPTPPTSSVVAAPAPVTPTSTTMTTPTSSVSITQITLPTTTTNPRLLGNDLGASHAGAIEKLDRFYQAIVRSDWDYTRAHFINAEGRGPNESNEWWQSQYGTIDEYWLAPVRVTGGVYWVGLVTHETNATGRYSYQFCIPFTISAEGFVQQSDQAVTRLTNKTDGAWIDHQQGVAPLMSC